MCPVKDYNQVVIDAANHTGVRSVKIPSTMRAEPQADAQCEWRICSPNTVGEFSATGYFFARTVHQALDIPIGLIEANKGGSRVESWLTKENLEKYTDDPTDSVAICNGEIYRRPHRLCGYLQKVGQMGLSPFATLGQRHIQPHPELYREGHPLLSRLLKRG